MPNKFFNALTWSSNYRTKDEPKLTPKERKEHKKTLERYLKQCLPGFTVEIIYKPKK